MAVAVEGEPLRPIGGRQGRDIRIGLEHRLGSIDEEARLDAHGQHPIEGLIAMIGARLIGRAGVDGVDIDDDAPKGVLAVADDLAEAEFGSLGLGHCP